MQIVLPVSGFAHRKISVRKSAPKFIQRKILIVIDQIKISELNVVIVDDHATMREVVKTILLSFGFRKIETLESGVFIRSPMDGFFADLVICDYLMDPIDGIEILKFFRQHDEIGINAIPFILMSADSEAETIAQPYFSGPTEFISKPFTPEALISRIQMVMGGSEKFFNISVVEDVDQNIGPMVSDQLAAEVPIVGAGQLFSDEMMNFLLDPL